MHVTRLANNTLCRDLKLENCDLDFWLFLSVGVVQGGEAISGAPLRSIMSKAVAVADQGIQYSFCYRHCMSVPSLRIIV